MEQGLSTLSITNDPTSYIRKLVTSKNVYRYPKNIGDKSEGLHHFMIIREYRLLEQEKQNDPYNGLTNFLEDNSFEISSYLTSSNTSESYQSLNSYVLFLPSGSLNTSYVADYQNVELGLIGKAFEQFSSTDRNRLQQAYNNYTNSNESFWEKTKELYGDVWQSLSPYTEKALDAYMNNFTDRIKYNAITAGATFLSPAFDASTVDIAAQSMRRQLNPYAALSFNGVRNLRQHSFNFEFKPRSADDAKNAIKIISNLKKGMLPSLGKHERDEVVTTDIQDDSLTDVDKNDLASMSTENKKSKTITTTNTATMPSQFFKFPNVYTITFYDLDGETTGNEYLFKIGQSVLESLSVKYGNTFFEDQSYPTNISLSISFKENFALNNQFATQGY